jgi:prevent-host-death family protein
VTVISRESVLREAQRGFDGDTDRGGLPFALLEVLLAVLLKGAFMAKIPKIVPISDLRQDAAAVLKRVRNSREPVVITQRGRASAVMLSVDAYEESEEERRILKALARGDREIQAGKGASLDAVLREGGKLLEQD